MNGTQLVRYTNPQTKETTIFVPLPPELWRVPDFGCICEVCKRDGTAAFWDTLVIGAAPPKAGRSDHASVCHYPELHPLAVRVAQTAKHRAGVPTT